MGSRGVYDRVVEGVKATLTHLVTGDTLLATTFSGPMINKTAMDRVFCVIERASSEHSGRLVLGGNACGGELADGYFIEATVFADVDPASSLAQNEIFGPVLSIIPFESEDEGLQIANSTSFGLTNYVETRDIARARRLARQLHSGTVSINGTPNMHVGAPFGGVGRSGIGREGGKEGLMEVISTKTVLIR